MAYGKKQSEMQSRHVDETVSASPKVVHCKKEAYDFYIGRSGKGTPSKYGNPFSYLDESAASVKVKNRDEAVDFYREWVLGEREVPGLVPPTLEEIRRDLKGKILGCWCSPARCHGDVLLELANALEPVSTSSKKPRP